MATFNGTSLTLKVGGNAIAQATSASVTLDSDTIDVSTKSSGGFQEVIQGQRSGTVDFEGLVDLNTGSTGNAKTIYDAWYNGSSVSWELNDGSYKIFGDAGFITNLTIDAPMEDVATYSGSIQISGYVSIAAV